MTQTEHSVAPEPNPGDPKHAPSWTGLHVGLYLFMTLTTLIWALLAVLLGGVSIYVVVLVLIVGFYSEAYLPYRILNAPPSRFLRRPRSTHFCFLLSLQAAWISMLAFCVGGYCAGTLYAASGASAWLIPPIVLLAIVTARFGARSILSLLKWAAVGSTRIIVFRRFSKDPAKRHLKTILPITGAYGYLITYSDESLAGAEKSALWESQELLAGTHYQMSHGDPRWQERVLFELKRADFAIFDWPTTPTAAMRLELELALNTLPASRMIWLLPSGVGPPSLSFLSTRLAACELKIIDRGLDYFAMARAMRKLVAQTSVLETRNTC